MGFLDVLRGWSGLAGDRDVDPRQFVVSPAEGGGTSHPEFPGDVPIADPEEMAAPPDSSSFDREQWRKKLARILDHLPRAEPEWADLAQEGSALGFEVSWLEREYRRAFTMMVRRAVADRKVTPDEHRRLDLARSLMGIPDAEAESIFHATLSEAESFFGGSISGG